MTKLSKDAPIPPWVDRGAGGVIWDKFAEPWAWDQYAHWVDNTGAIYKRQCLTTACGALIPITEGQGPMIAESNSTAERCPGCLEMVG